MMEMIMNPTKRSLTVIAIVAALAVITTSTIVTPAFAIKRFYNCMTDIANNSGRLTIGDVNTCYDKEYHSQQGLFLLTHSQSTGGGNTASSNK